MRRFEARISGVDAADFPPIPKVDEGIKTKVDTATLRQAINQVVFAAPPKNPAGTDRCGCSIRWKHGNTGRRRRFRLAVYRMPLAANVKEKAEVIILRTLNELNRLIADDEETVDITVNPIRARSCST